ATEKIAAINAAYDAVARERRIRVPLPSIHRYWVFHPSQRGSGAWPLATNAATSSLREKRLGTPIRAELPLQPLCGLHAIQRLSGRSRVPFPFPQLWS